jgi:hypothetical protein
MTPISDSTRDFLRRGGIPLSRLNDLTVENLLAKILDPTITGRLTADQLPPHLVDVKKLDDGELVKLARRVAVLAQSDAEQMLQLRAANELNRRKWGQSEHQ